MKAAVVGIAGPVLAEAEIRLFRRHPPAGVALFGRNVRDPAQLAALSASLRAILPESAVLMIDQEGGRVARLRPPHWRAHPAAARIGALHAADPPSGRRAAWLTGALIGLECRAAGLDTVCAPVLDLAVAGAHDVIGDRAYAADAASVAVLGRAMADGLLAAGMQPVAKHAPGHGRATCDSHLALPRVATQPEEDLAPFVRNADLPWMMTAHILYGNWDAQRPGTISPVVVGQVIRGRIGFGGVLVSDDLAMQALSGPPDRRAAAALAAGCDLALHCSGAPADNEALLAACPALGTAASGRIARARALAAARCQPLDETGLAAERERLLG